MIDHSCLIGQFVVSATDNRAPTQWISERIGHWFLGRHPALPSIRLLGADDRPLGWILGYPISEAGTLLADGETLRLPLEAQASTDALETFIDTFGGRLAVVVLDARHPRFYLDPFGSLSAVFCAHQRMVASTPNLIPYDARTRDRVELAQAIGFPYRQGWYPPGLTPRYDVDRIPPNHYLDLSDWRTLRHWPKEPLREEACVEDALTEIAALVKRNIAAIVSAIPTYLKLTAGHDSRMLLACARALADRFELLTADFGDRSSAIDCDTARRIAKRFGLKHRIQRWETATEEDLQEWTFRTGNAVGEVRGWQSATMHKRLPGWHAMLDGMGGELARGFAWRDDDTETTLVSPERLVALCSGCSLFAATVFAS